MKLIEVVPFERTCVNAAVQCIKETYLSGEEFIFTKEEYVAWFLPFLSDGTSDQPGMMKKKKAGGRKKKK